MNFVIRDVLSTLYNEVLHETIDTGIYILGQNVSENCCTNRCWLQMKEGIGMKKEGIINCLSDNYSIESSKL